jgi:hypothetical protein
MPATRVYAEVAWTLRWMLSENLRHAVVFGAEEVGDLDASSDV